jgi:hypothetical protein
MAAAAAMLFAFAGAAHANVRVKPTAIAFGTATSGTSVSAAIVAPHTVTLTNDDRHSITISSATTSISQFSFSGPSFPVTLAPGKSLTGTVSFNPTSAEPYSGRLVFQQANGNEFSVALGGT